MGKMHIVQREVQQPGLWATVGLALNHPVCVVADMAGS